MPTAGDSTSTKGFCPFSLVMFLGTGIAYTRHLQNKKSKDDNTNATPFRVVFVLGG